MAVQFREVEISFSAVEVICHCGQEFAHNEVSEIFEEFSSPRCPSCGVSWEDDEEEGE